MRTETEHFDVIVIGGGPAGISAACWCADLGLSVAMIEREAELGGQLLWIFGAIENYLGISADNGRQLRDTFLKQLEGRAITRMQGVGVQDPDLRSKAVILADGREMFARAVVIATGVRRRRLGIPGETEFIGKGILESGQRAREEVADARVVIIGGGDAALENALILSETAQQVIVVHRRDRFSARGEFVSEASNRANIEFLYDTTVTAIVGGARVQGVEVLSHNGPLRIDCDFVLLRIGVEPNVDLFGGVIGVDERGYLRVNADCSTDLEGVYAAGDVACPVSPTIATAVGMGATAAKAITARLAKDRA